MKTSVFLLFVSYFPFSVQWEVIYDPPYPAKYRTCPPEDPNGIFVCVYMSVENCGVKSVRFKFVNEFPKPKRFKHKNSMTYIIKDKKKLKRREKNPRVYFTGILHYCRLVDESCPRIRDFEMRILVMISL
ncbi:hypothetical protein RB195_015318 [Necator americanus]|uniref:Uncharacterized protein n=1 Tax=Necator americanus TaxID=51031 RepID=A0ABR1E6N2_NECAM